MSSDKKRYLALLAVGGMVLSLSGVAVAWSSMGMERIARYEHGLLECGTHARCPPSPACA